jgi:hypothetical protein
MNSDSILTIIVLVVLMIIILRSKPFKVWWMGRNKTDDQKKAIKFLIYGPSRSKISKDEYDTICHGTYPSHTIFEKAKSKLGISDSDIVRHPCKDINHKGLLEWNYIKNGEKVLFLDLGLNEFRSSRMDGLMVIFGREKLYFYQFSYRTDKTEETETTYSYAYDDIRQFKVDKISTMNEFIYASIDLQKEISEEDSKNEKKRKESWQSFPSMVMSKKSFDAWKAIGTHLDSTELKKEYKDKTMDEKNALRYFKAYFNLPLAITDEEYEAMIVKTLPSEELRETGMNNMGIEEADIQLATPIAFRSFVYDQDTLEIKGRDGSWRSNDPQHTWLFFGKHQIYVYSASMLMDSSIKQQSTQEIFYKDITSIRTEQLSREKVEGDIVYRLSYYKFTILFSGDSLSLTLPILTDENDKKIRAMRNLLRETKHSYSPEEAAREEDTV